MRNISLNHKNECAEKHYLDKKLNERVIQLEKELQHTKECLQISNGELSSLDTNVRAIH